MNDLIERQMELENYAMGHGMERYRKQLAIGGQDDSAPGQRLMRLNVEPAAAAIREWMESIESKRVGRKSALYEYVKGLDPAALALITVKYVVASLSGDTKLTRASRLIGQAIESHKIWIDMLRDDKGLAVKVGRQL